MAKDVDIEELPHYLQQYKSVFETFDTFQEIAKKLGGRVSTYELDQLKAVLEWAYEQCPFQIGDMVEYVRHDKIGKDSGWFYFKNAFKVASLEVKEIRYMDIPSKGVGWSCLCELQEYKWYSFGQEYKEGPILCNSTFNIWASHLKHSNMSGRKKWLDETLEEANQKLLDHQKQERTRKRKASPKYCSCCGQKLSKKCDC